MQTVQSNARRKADISDIENFEVNEPKLGSITRLPSRQGKLFDNCIRKPLVSPNLELGENTTRSSPRLAFASAVSDNGALILLDI